MTTALITCGALIREVLVMKEKYAWDAEILALPAVLHNRPEQIAERVLACIEEARQVYARIIVLYGDCGTRGSLDAALEAKGIQRLQGPHCFEMYSRDVFQTLMDEEPGTFFLTDYLVRFFQPLVVKELGLDRFPGLRGEYFRHYKRVVYLSQRPDSVLDNQAREAAQFLGLPLQVVHTGFGALEVDLLELMNADGY